MKKEEIKAKTEVLTMLLDNMVNEKNKLKNSFDKKINSYDDSIKKLIELRYDIRCKCKHKFKGKPTMMGKGICIICGYDDY